jgi:hypothetical protein
MIDTDKSPELSEPVWQAWIKKNKARDSKLERRLRILVFAAVPGLVAVLLWELMR